MAAPGQNFARFARLSFPAPLGLTPAQTRAKGFILWTPSLCPDEALPSTRQDLAALDPPLLFLGLTPAQSRAPSP